MLELVGQPGGPLADAALWPLEVTDSFSLTPSFRRLVLTAPGLDGLHHQPGQDLMLRVPLGAERVVNRRYTIRSFDPRQKAVTIDVSLHGAGPGTDWISAARPGDHIDAIGPRGKVTVRPEADWHLFVADETGIPGALAMLEALPTGTPAIALLEVDTGADEQGLVAPLGGFVRRALAPSRWAGRCRVIPGPCWRRSRRWISPAERGTRTSSAEAGVVRARRPGASANAA